MSERIAISHDDQEKLSAQGCYIERSSATEEQIAEACKTDLKGLKAKLATYWVSTELLASLKAEVKPIVQPVTEPVTVWVKSDRAWSADSWNTGWDAAKKQLPKESGEGITDPLPIAPITTFNIIRLIQLGYIPLEKPSGKIGQVKWAFYWPNAVTQWGNGKVNGWALDWANSKGGGAYRAMLEADISKVNDELKAYQKNTATTFGFKVELEKQLGLLESLKAEKDPKRIIEIANEYVTSRSRSHFSHGAVGYDMPIVRKTAAQLDIEVARAESKTQAREDRIKADEKDLKALTSKWEKDSDGKVRMTKEEVEKQNKKRVEKVTSMSNHKIWGIEKQLATKRAEQAKFQSELDAAKANIQRLNTELATARLNYSNRTATEINSDLALERAKPKVNEATIKGLQAELRVINEVARIKWELAKLGSLDGRGNPIQAAAGTSVVHDTSTDLEKTKWEVTKLEWDVETAKKNKEKLLKEASIKGQDNLENHAKEITLKEKHIRQWKEILVKRQDAETRIAETNTRIKDIESKLAAGPVISERLKLETDLRELYEARNVAAQKLETALKSNNGRNDAATKTAVEWQKTEIQKELDKVRQLSVEMDTIKTRIDAIQADAQAAKDALNNEKDPVKAKKLRDEMPAKINAANQQILELNNAGMKLTSGTGINWNKIPDLELQSVLKKNLLLAKFLATPQGMITKAETFGQTPGGQKTMKVVYGGLKWVAVAGAARTVGNEVAAGDMKAAGLDALDAGMWFLGMIPGGNIVSGLYDIGMAGKQFATWTDINGRKVGTTQTFVRLGFWVVWLIPIVGNVVKWAAAAKWMIKTVWAVEKVENGANIAMKWAILAQAGTMTYDVIDVFANMFRDPVSTAMRVVKWQEQPWIMFQKPPVK